MSKFLIINPEIYKLNLSDQEFRVYFYICSQFNMKKKQAYVRIVDIAGQFQLTKNEVENILINFTKIIHDGHALVSIDKSEGYYKFDLPSHQKFLSSIGFAKHNQAHGFRAINGYLKQLKETANNYLFKDLDQYELMEKLESMSVEELQKIKPEQLRYQWVYKNVIKNRTTA